MGAQVHYRDIGDYLTAEQKLTIVDEGTIATVPWAEIEPNESADWVTQRDRRYSQLLALDKADDALFTVSSQGTLTARDQWVYSSSRAALNDRIDNVVTFYNEQVDQVESQRSIGERAAAKDLIDKDPSHYSWATSDYPRIERGERIERSSVLITRADYRPFYPQWLARHRGLIHRLSRIDSFFPSGRSTNISFSVTDPGNTTPPFVIATAAPPDLGLAGDKHSRYYARWRYEEAAPDSLLGAAGNGPTRVSNLSAAGVRRFRDELGQDIVDDDVFAYVYAVLHSPEFRETFAVNLRKEAPRVPIAIDRPDFDAFVAAGRELLELHVSYETAEPHPLVEEWTAGSDPDVDPDLLLIGERKMRYPRETDPITGEKGPDKTRLIYNDYLTLSEIPLRSHDYMLGNRSGIDWIIDRWYVKTDRTSGIVNDVNQWGLERGQPRYIIELVKRVVAVSLRTVEIVETLPRLTF